MPDLTPTPLERKLLRGLAAHAPDPDGWWSGAALAAAFPADFGAMGANSLSSLGRHCTNHGFARTRVRGGGRNVWKEWRITSLGTGLVADSCIGGGLRWEGTGLGRRCPACLTPYGSLVAGPRGAGTVPAHALPGYESPAKARSA